MRSACWRVTCLPECAVLSLTSESSRRALERAAVIDDQVAVALQTSVAHHPEVANVIATFFGADIPCNMAAHVFWCSLPEIARDFMIARPACSQVSTNSDAPVRLTISTGSGSSLERIVDICRA